MKRPIDPSRGVLLAVLLAGCQLGDDGDDPAFETAEAELGIIACHGSDECAEGQECICGPGGCGCGELDPVTCDPVPECGGDGDCGDGQCCFEGHCVAANADCECGYGETTWSRTASPGCPDGQQAVDMATEIARTQCQMGAPMYGDQCTALGTCDADIDVASSDYVCVDAGEHMAGVIASVCTRCVIDKPDDGPDPQPKLDACELLGVEIANKKAEINDKRRELDLLWDGLRKHQAALAATRAHYQAIAAAEAKLIQGHYGNWIGISVAANVTSAVTEIVSAGKSAKLPKEAGCLFGRICKTFGPERDAKGRFLRVGTRYVATSKKAWNEVYEPTINLGLTQLAAQAPDVCGLPDAEASSWDWFPGFDEGSWAIGCFTREHVMQEMGEKKSNALNHIHFLEGKIVELEHDIEVAAGELAALQAELAALEAEYAETCSCQLPPPDDGSGSGSGSGGGSGSGSGF
jgi:hypothetical protein